MEGKYNKEIGRFGEELAAKYLERLGYKILATNIKIGYKEIDILAKIKEEVVFVEVKTRTSRSYGMPEDSVGAKKIGNLKRALGSFIYRHKINPNKARLDLISIEIDKYNNKANIKHYKHII